MGAIVAAAWQEKPGPRPAHGEDPEWTCQRRRALGRSVDGDAEEQARSTRWSTPISRFGKQADSMGRHPFSARRAAEPAFAGERGRKGRKGPKWGPRRLLATEMAPSALAFLVRYEKYRLVGKSGCATCFARGPVVFALTAVTFLLKLFGTSNERP